MSQFTDHQRAQLLAPIQDFRVQELDGQSHLAAWDVIAHLNRVFGFEGWDKEILNLEPVYEHVGTRTVTKRRNGQSTQEQVPACSVGYRCTMRLTVRNPDGQVVRVVEDAAMGTATNQRDLGDAHDLAMKSSVSYALKRCAKDLGDQFGLSLYNKGQMSPLVGGSHVLPAPPEGEGPADLQADVPQQESMGHDEIEKVSETTEEQERVLADSLGATKIEEREPTDEERQAAAGEEEQS